MDADRGLLLAKTETTPGTDAVPTAAANAIQVLRDMTLRPDPKFLQRRNLSDNLSLAADVPAGTLININFGFEIKGAGGAVDAVARYDPILQAFGFGRTINTGVDVTWGFINSGFAPTTIYAYMDGILHKLIFGFGRRLSISEQVREFPLFRAEMSALYVAPVDAAIASGAVFDPSAPVKVESLGLTLGGYSPVATALEIAIETGLSTRFDINALEGIKGFQLGGERNVTGGLDPEAVTEATHPFWANFKNGTTVALGGNTIGTAVGNRVQITGAAVQYDGPNWSRREQLRTYQLGLRFRRSADALSDEVKIVTK